MIPSARVNFHNNETIAVNAAGNQIKHGIYRDFPTRYHNSSPHVYTLIYTTTRQIGFFKDHGELFWNVTGNGWGFVIQNASATVHSPSNIAADDVKLSGLPDRRAPAKLD